MHNLKVEDCMEIVANSITSQHLTLILEEIEQEVRTQLKETDDSDEGEQEFLVTTFYYPDCECVFSRKSKCKTRSCQCFKTGKKY